jgi:hypothetical protein
MYAYKPNDLFLLVRIEYLPHPLFTGQGHLKVLSPYFPVHSNAPVTSLKLELLKFYLFSIHMFICEDYDMQFNGMDICYLA